MAEDTSRKGSIIEEDSSRWDIECLPGTVHPKHYLVVLNPQIDTCILTGEVEISIEIDEPLEVIILHAAELVVSSVKVEELEGSKDNVEILKSFSYPKREYWVFQLSRKIQGMCLLNLKYNGKISEKAHGLYKCTYQPQLSTVTRYCILSHFEPTFARYAFPCFDEPRFRATFRINLVRPSGDSYIALSNMPQEKCLEDDPTTGLTTVQFEITQLMPTFLVCVAIGAFGTLTQLLPVQNCATSVDTYSELSQRAYTYEARAVAQLALEFLNTYFRISVWDLVKLDLVAVPEARTAHISNWGIISFKESTLVLNGEELLCDYEEHMVEQVSTAVAHLWFGNWVTINQWTDVWLIETFAKYIGYLCANRIKPDLYQEWNFLLNQLQPLLVADSSPYTHQLDKGPSTPQTSAEIFNFITCNKGGCVLRMISNLDPEGFQDGVGTYVRQCKFGSNLKLDLWSALHSKMPTFDIENIMETWTKQEGYPLISVKCEDSTLIVTQERFIYRKSAKYYTTQSTFGFKWEIPITYVSSFTGGKSFVVWLTRDKLTAKLPLPPGEHWIKLNWHQVGYFRVNYSIEEWSNLSLLLVNEPDALDPEDKGNLIDDAFCLAEAGYLTYEVPLQLLTYLRTETNFFPWSVASRHLQILYGRLENTEAQQLLKNFIVLLMERHLNGNMWKLDKMNYYDKKFNLEILNLAFRIECEPVMRLLGIIFNNWMEEKDTLTSQMKGLVCKYGLRHKLSEKVWTTIWKLYVNENILVEKEEILFCLPAVVQPLYIERLMDLAKNPSMIRSEHYFRILSLLSVHPKGNEIVWHFVRTEWDYLVDRFTLKDARISELIGSILKDWHTEEKLKEINNFYDTHSDEVFSSNFRYTTLMDISNNIAWYPEHFYTTKSWLEMNAPNGN